MKPGRAITLALREQRSRDLARLQTTEAIAAALLGWEYYRQRPVDAGVVKEARDRAEIVLIAVEDRGEWTMA